jgi:hypothetical protein
MGLAEFIVDSFKRQYRLHSWCSSSCLSPTSDCGAQAALKPHQPPTVILPFSSYSSSLSETYHEFQIGYLTPHLIPFALLIVPYIQQQDEKREGG